MTKSMKIKSFDSAVQGSTTSKTFGNIWPRATAELSDVLAGVTYIAQRMIGLTTRTYYETDYILTYNADTEGGGD